MALHGGGLKNSGKGPMVVVLPQLLLPDSLQKLPTAGMQRNEFLEEVRHCGHFQHDGTRRNQMQLGTCGAQATSPGATFPLWDVAEFAPEFCM
jgi:hypothetical protein